jgi:hypothetical protein
MRGIRLTAVPTAVLAAAAAVVLVAATPASAAASLTHLQVVHATLSAKDLGAGWHTYDAGSSGADPSVQGCEGTSFRTTGLRYDVERDYQFDTAATFVNEDLQTFRTQLAAGRDFTKGLKSFSGCTSLTVDGKSWTVKRLTVSDYADRTALFRLRGAIGTAAGDVPIVMFLSVAKFGHHEIETVIIVGGQITAAELTGIRNSSVRINRLATDKVRLKLGR